MPLIESCRLVCTTQGHNKEYVIELHEDLTGRRQFRVDGRYGRIGSRLTGMRKYDGPSQVQAQAEYEKLRQEKLNKGYQEVPATNAFLQPATEVSDPAPRRSRAPAAPPVPDNTVDFYDNAPRVINL